MAANVVMTPRERACLDRMRILLAAQGFPVTDEDLVQVVLKAALRLEGPVLQRLIREGLAEAAKEKERARPRDRKK